MDKTYVLKGTTQRVRVQKESDSEVEFSPLGGGFLYRMPAAKFHSKHVLETEPPPIVRAQFSGDWTDEVFDGYTVSGKRWNGWGCPYFTKETADKIAALLPGLAYNEANDSFDCDDQGDLDQFVGGEVDLPELGKVKVYAIGSGCWCWDVKEIGNPASPSAQ